MDGINKKPMQDMLVPGNTMPARRPSMLPEVDSTSRTDISDRITKNSFFEKTPVKTSSSFSPEKKTSRGRMWFILFIVMIAMGGILFAIDYFSGATVKIVPVVKEASLNHEFTAEKSPTGNALAFQYMSLEETMEKEVPTVEEKKVQYKASGKVAIYNAYNGNSQRLIKNTRLETPDHKIFRIRDSVVVPGAKMVNGKVANPGSVLAVVDADLPGKEYNVGLADFTIPGFKESKDLERYAKFTARSMENFPIQGGFSGTIKVPAEEDVARVRVEIKDALKEVALKKAEAEIPEKVSFFPGSIVLTFEEMSPDLSVEAANKVVMKATVSVFFFDTELLTEKIMDVVFPDYEGGPLTVRNIPEISFTFNEAVDNVILSDISRITFTLRGEPSFVGKIDTKKITSEIVGKGKKDFNTFIESQKNIQKADAVIRPFWETVFPTDPTQIEIKIIEG